MSNSTGSKSSVATVRCIIKGKQVTFRTPGDAKTATILDTADLSGLPVGNCNSFGWKLLGKSLQGMISRTFGPLSPDKAIASAKAFIAELQAGKLPEPKRGRVPVFQIIYARANNLTVDEAGERLAATASKYGKHYDAWQKLAEVHPLFTAAKTAYDQEQAAAKIAAGKGPSLAEDAPAFEF